MKPQCAIIGVGETGYSRAPEFTTRALASQAICNAAADAGIALQEIDGMLSHSMNDSCASPIVAADLGVRLNFHMDCIGGGAAVEALVGLAVGAIEAGMCRTVAIFRSMNGFTQVRTGGTTARSTTLGDKSPAPAKTRISGDELHTKPYGWASPAQIFAPAFRRHMHEYGTTSAQAAMVKVIHSEHAARNPKAIYPQRVTVEQVLASRKIADPLHLLDCCTETNSGTCLIVTSLERARDARHVPVLIRSVAGRVCKPRSDMHYQSGSPATTAGIYAKELLWSNAGLRPEDVDITAAYDAFTFTSLILLEDYGFCAKGEGGTYVSDGTTRLGGRRPNNTSGGLLCEGYSNGMNLVIENVRQLRNDCDDGCPVGPDGMRRHTHDYSEEGTCRQVRDAHVAANLGWGTPGVGSALVLSN